MSGEFSDREIVDTQLTLEDVPELDAPWGAINRFALTADGYQRSGTFERCAEIGNSVNERFRLKGKLPRDLAQPRTALFFEQRRWTHFGEAPEGKDLAYIRALVSGIRDAVREGVPGSGADSSSISKSDGSRQH